MKAESGSLLFIQDKLDNTKKRPFMCVHVFANAAGVPYDWLIMPITSSNSVGAENLVEVTHVKLATQSWVKINNMGCISWDDEKIEVSKRKFRKQYVKDVLKKLSEIFNPKKDE